MHIQFRRLLKSPDLREAFRKQYSTFREWVSTSAEELFRTHGIEMMPMEAHFELLERESLADLNRVPDVIAEAWLRAFLYEFLEVQPFRQQVERYPGSEDVEAYATLHRHVERSGNAEFLKLWESMLYGRAFLSGGLMHSYQKQPCGTFTPAEQKDLLNFMRTHPLPVDPRTSSMRLRQNESISEFKTLFDDLTKLFTLTASQKTDIYFIHC